MDQDQRLLHSSSFGAAAAAYAEHRPDYAQDAVRWALEPAPGPRVLDLGAGTGKLTATLVALGVDVIAVEPDPAMLAQLRRTLPTVRAPPGTAEAIPLRDGSVDAVLAARSADPTAPCREAVSGSAVMRTGLDFPIGIITPHE
ncbi:class I SAM-dependent methyltransferase [Streptomyces sp. NPDC006465]|uniref:class I SAM-dependent methyltransferase n=1 Tax=Streptomyces sp. NPDC006465 TaxID=3157174 RepID=UPI0033A9AEA7